MDPLTGLPGPEEIEAEIQRRAGIGRPFVTLRVDIHNLKSYNDRYGFAMGDAAICAVASLVQQAVGDLEPGKAYAGHMGRDDFVLILDTDKQPSR